MDGFAFDRLTRTLTAAGSRRRALGGLLAGTLGFLGTQTEDVAAKNCKKIANKKKRKKCLARARRCTPQCAGKTCGSDGCGGQCGPACPSGCCANGTCAPGTSAAACGAPGQSCAVCAANSPCDSLACVDTCGVVVSSGPPARAQFAIQDPDGLTSIVVTRSENADTIVPPFTPGTTDIVVVTSTKINQTQEAVVVMTIVDTPGNSRRCGVRF